jgi:DinB superfamily
LGYAVAMSEAEDLRASLSAVRERLLTSIAGVSEELFKKRPPATDEETGPVWCIAEVLAHLLQQERLRGERIALALQQDGVEIAPSTDEAHHEAARAGRGAPVPQLIHGLLASRREIERLLDQAVSSNDGLDRATYHPRLGRQTIGWIVREKVIAHEAEHVAQIESIKARLQNQPAKTR